VLPLLSYSAPWADNGQYEADISAGQQQQDFSGQTDTHADCREGKNES
jgi:hypothetical protein